MLRVAVDVVNPVEGHVERHDLSHRAGEHLVGVEERADPLGEGGMPQGRAAEVGDAQLEAALDVPGHVRPDLARMLAKQRAQVGREPEGPPGPEDKVGAGQVRGRVDHLAAQVGEHLPGRRERLQHRGLHRQAEVGAPRDPDPPQVTFQQARDLIRLGHWRRGVEGQRHPGVRAGQDHQQQRDVGDRACHRPSDAEHVGHVGEWPVGDAAGRRAQPDHVAEAGRDAQRAAEVAAVGQADHPRRQGGRRAAAAAARAPAQVKRVAGGAEHGIDGVRARAELRHVGLAQADRTRRGHPLHDQRVPGWHVLGEQRGAVGGAHASGVEEVLVRHRQAVEQPGAFSPGQQRVRGGGLGQRCVEAPGDHGVDGPVQGLDPCDVRGDDLARRHLPAAQHSGQRDRVFGTEILHQALPSRSGTFAQRLGGMYRAGTRFSRREVTGAALADAPR